MNINTFIFDLGGVIINLDESATIQSFSKLTGISQNEIVSKVSQSPIFQQYEKGLLTSKEFRAGISLLFDCNFSDQQIDNAWNAMLGAIPIERLELLLALKEKYQIMILSNTNEIHIEAFNKILYDTSGQNSLTYFAHHVYFSHDLNMRKPDLEIYKEVLLQSKTIGSEALFLDDKLENLEGAEKVGINTFHVKNPNEIFKLKKYV